MSVPASGETASGQSGADSSPSERTASGRLYTPQMLALATGLSVFPPLTDAAHHGSARSDTCGGSLTLNVDLDEGRVRALGMMVQACAVGQASAALFAQWAIERSTADVARSSQGVADWLKGEGPLPSGPDLTPIAAAQAYSARHGAILLPWRAFADAMQLPTSHPA